jgi:hypothetical protein
MPPRYVSYDSSSTTLARMGIIFQSMLMPLVTLVEAKFTKVNDVLA